MDKSQEVANFAKITHVTSNSNTTNQTSTQNFVGKQVTIEQGSTNTQTIGQSRSQQPVKPLSSVNVSKNDSDVAKNKKCKPKIECLIKNKTALKNYKKSREITAKSCFEFLTSRNKGKFIDMYSLGVKKGLVVQGLREKAAMIFGMSNAFYVAFFLYKKSILGLLAEFHDSLFFIIYNSIQSEAKAVEKALAKTTKVCNSLSATDLTFDDFKLASEQNSDADKHKEIYDLVSDVIIIENLSSSASTTKLRSMLIGFVYNNFNLNFEVLKEYVKSLEKQKADIQQKPASKDTKTTQSIAQNKNVQQALASEDIKIHTCRETTDTQQKLASTDAIISQSTEQNDIDTPVEANQDRSEIDKSKNTSFISKIWSLIKLPIDAICCFCRWLVDVISGLFNKKTEQSVNIEIVNYDQDTNNVVLNLDDDAVITITNNGCITIEDAEDTVAVKNAEDVAVPEATTAIEITDDAEDVAVPEATTAIEITDDAEGAAVPEATTTVEGAEDAAGSEATTAIEIIDDTEGATGPATITTVEDAEDAAVPEATTTVEDAEDTEDATETEATSATKKSKSFKQKAFKVVSKAGKAVGKVFNNITNKAKPNTKESDQPPEPGSMELNIADKAKKEEKEKKSKVQAIENFFTSIGKKKEKF